MKISTSVLILASLSSAALGSRLALAESPPENQTTGLLTLRTLSLSQAMTAAKAALDTCTRLKYSVSVAIVDREGAVKLLLRNDAAVALTLDAARRKAYTSVNTGMATGKFEKFLSAHPELSGARQLDDFLPLGGGLPVMAGREIVGAIGVSGAPTIEADEACAQAGLDALNGSLGD